MSRNDAIILQSQRTKNLRIFFGFDSGGGDEAESFRLGVMISPGCRVGIRVGIDDGDLQEIVLFIFWELVYSISWIDRRRGLARGVMTMQVCEGTSIQSARSNVNGSLLRSEIH